MRRPAAFLFAIVLVAGCGSASTTPAPPAATPTGTPMASASATPVATRTATPTPVPSPTATAVPKLLPAYFRNWMPSKRWPRDSSGVVIQSYGGKIGRQYMPTRIAQAALAFYDRWLVDTDPTQTAKDKRLFQTQIKWLIANQTSDGRWLVNFAWGGQQVPWWSAMTEGLAMSALLRSYWMTRDPACLTAITRARTTFERDRDRHHGVAQSVVDGSKTYVVYEEYLEGYQTNVLNGWIFSLVGLYETATYLGDKAASADLRGPDRGLAAVKALLHYYDTGKWSYYNRDLPVTATRKNLDTVSYHSLVIGQLRYLTQISGDPFFAGYADKFQGYLDACTAAGKCPPGS